jgi:hypothetical protein
MEKAIDSVADSHECVVFEIGYPHLRKRRQTGTPMSLSKQTHLSLSLSAPRPRGNPEIGTQN